MPRGDGTGPAGMGPMTGRAAGFCAGYGVPGYMNPVGGRGFRNLGRCFGGSGRGWRHWFYATGLPWGARGGWPASGDISYDPGMPSETPEQELDGLRQQAEYLQNTLDGIHKRIEELDSQKASEQ
jgi:hypothetical protein